MWILSTLELSTYYYHVLEPTGLPKNNEGETPREMAERLAKEKQWEFEHTEQPLANLWWVRPPFEADEKIWLPKVDRRTLDRMGNDGLENGSEQS